MTCVLHQPSLEEAMVMFLPGGEAAGSVAGPGAVAGLESGGDIPAVELLKLPDRPVLPGVARRLFLAVLRQGRVRIRYNSIHGGGMSWRWIRPHAFAHDGSRWHARAWCEKNSEFRDFSLCRMADAEWPEEEPAAPPKPDTDWETWTTLTLRPHRALSSNSRDAVELDYGMKKGVITVRVRLAMENYLRARLRLPLRNGSEPEPRLELAE